MPRYTFRINNGYITVDGCDLEDALRQAGINEDDPYELIEEDDFVDKCLLSAITDDILFGS